MSYAEQNQKVITELEALIEKLGYGSLDNTFEIHNKRITSVTVFGKKRTKYNKNNFTALQDLVDRIKKSINKKETTKLTVLVDIRNGIVEETLLLSKITLKYDAPLDKGVV